MVRNQKIKNVDRYILLSLEGFSGWILVDFQGVILEMILGRFCAKKICTRFYMHLMAFFHLLDVPTLFLTFQGFCLHKIVWFAKFELLGYLHICYCNNVQVVFYNSSFTSIYYRKNLPDGSHCVKSSQQVIQNNKKLVIYFFNLDKQS